MLDDGDIELDVGYFNETPAHHRLETLCHHAFAYLFDQRQLGREKVQ